MVPENIHTPPTEGIIGNSGEEGGGSQRPKNLKQYMKLNWNLWRGGGVIGQIPSVGGMDIFWNHTIESFVMMVSRYFKENARKMDYGELFFLKKREHAPLLPRGSWL